MGNSNNKVHKSFSVTVDSNISSLRANSKHAASIGRLFGSAQDISSSVKLRKSKSSQLIWQSTYDDALFEPEYPLHGPVSMNDFQIIETVALGAYGDVMKVLNRIDNSVYAMKIMNKKRIYEGHAVDQVKRETNIQTFACQLSFITMVYASLQSPHYLHLVMKYEPRGDLFELWKKFDCFTELLTQIYIAELALTLDFLHKNGIIFRDLKMENILVDCEGHIRLTDFGLAKWLRLGQRTRTICGTLRYTAPELLSMNPYGHSVDWWSLGIIAYAMLLGEFPIATASGPEEMAVRIATFSYDMVSNDRIVSYDAQQLVGQLLDKEAGRRLQSVADLEKLPFFEHINFDAILMQQFRPIELWEESACGSRKSVVSLRENAFLGFESSVFHVNGSAYQWTDNVSHLHPLFI